jgi:hypothetical protein
LALGSRRNHKALEKSSEQKLPEKLTYQQPYAVFGKLLPPHVFNNHRQQLLD